MPTVFIANLAVQLPSRFAAGDVIGETAAEMLNIIKLQRLKSKLRYMYAKGEVSEDELQAKATELNNAELVPYMTADDDEDDNDPVVAEALAIARELITAKMAQEGLPPPKGIDIHAKALVDGMPQLLERARARLEARYAAAASAMEDLA